MLDKVQVLGRALLVFAACTVFPVQAENSLTNPNLSQLLSPIKTMTAAFTQTVTDAKGVVLQLSSGELSIAEPNRIRWTVNQPMPQQIISNGVRIWLFDPDLEQVIIQAYDSNLAATPAGLFSGDSEAINSAFSVTHDQSVSAVNSYILTPKSNDALYQSLRFDFSEQQPQALAFIDSLNQTTRIEFSDVLLNPTLADKLFTFEIPDGIDVINHVD